MKRLVILAATLALLATACELQINLLVDLGEDGSGDVAFQFAADEEMRQLFELGAEGQSLEDLLFTDSPFGELPDASLREFQDGDLTVIEASASFDNVAEAEALLTGPDNPFSDFSYETTGDRATLAATIEVPDLAEGGDLGIDPSTFTDDIFSFNIRIKMPEGSVTSNADEVLSDGTLQWAVPLTGGNLRIEAESEFGGGMPPLLIGLLVLGALALLGIVTVLVRRRGSKSPSVVSDMDAPVAPDGWTTGIGEASDVGPADPFAVAPADPEATSPDLVEASPDMPTPDTTPPEVAMPGSTPPGPEITMPAPDVAAPEMPDTTPVPEIAMPAPDIAAPEMPDTTPQVPGVPGPETVPMAPERTIPIIEDVPEPPLTADSTITFDDEPLGDMADDSDEEV